MTLQLDRRLHTTFHTRIYDSSILSMILGQKLFVQNITLTGVVLERDFGENSCSESFCKIGEVINKGLIS